MANQFLILLVALSMKKVDCSLNVEVREQPLFKNGKMFQTTVLVFFFQ